MNILIVGLGSIAQKHIQALKRIDSSFVIYALRSSRNSTNADGIINVYSLEELDGIIIDFAIISNPTSEHKKTIDSLLFLRCPLFIEKPLYYKLDIADILAKLKKLNILTYTACNLRFFASLEYIKNEISKNSKRVNEVNVYCGSYLPEWRKDCDFRKNYSAISALGGGVHVDLIHEFDYLYWVFGMPTNIYSIFRSNSSLSIDAFDYANYCLDYNFFCANVVLNYYRRDYKRTFEIVFENETWLVDISKNEITCNGNVIFSSNQKMIDTYFEQMNYFIKLINLKSKDSINTIFDAYNVLKICLKG